MDNQAFNFLLQRLQALEEELKSERRERMNLAARLTQLSESFAGLQSSPSRVESFEPTRNADQFIFELGVMKAKLNSFIETIPEWKILKEFR